MLLAAAVLIGGVSDIGRAGGPKGARAETQKMLDALAAAPAPLSAPAPAPAPAPTDAASDTPALASTPTVKHVRNVPGLVGGHVAIEGDRLYAGANGAGMRIFSIADPANPVEIGRYVPGPSALSRDTGVRMDAVPDAAVLDGRHIVALGGTYRAESVDQTEFLDVTDPANPRVLARFTGGRDGEAHNADIVDERKLWLPSGGWDDNGLRIYDMGPLLGGGYVSPDHMILTRADPVKLWRDSPYRKRRPVGPRFTHTHDLEVYVDRQVRLPSGPGDEGAAQYAKRDIVLLAEGGYYEDNTGSIFVIDITDPRNPVVLNRWMHGAKSSRPIRYFHEVQFLDGQPDVMIVTDEHMEGTCEQGGVRFLRVSPDLTSAEKIGEWFNGLGTPAGGMCSTHVFSTHGNHMFIGSYGAGLQVVDVTDPQAPKRAGQMILPGTNAWGALWHKGHVYVGEWGARGLDVFTFTP